MKKYLLVALVVALVALAMCGKKEEQTNQGGMSQEVQKSAKQKHELPLPEKLPSPLGDHIATKVGASASGPVVIPVKETNDLLALIQEGQKTLLGLPSLEYTEEAVFANQKTKKGKVKKVIVGKKTNYSLMLAVASRQTRKVELISISKKDAKSSTSAHVPGGEFSFSWDKWNGCNTPFDIKKPDGYIVLAVRCLLESRGQVESLVYTPYTKDIDTKELREAGYAYLKSKLEGAQKELVSQDVRSKAFSQELVGNVVPMSVAFRLALIEHIDPYLINKKSPQDLVNQVLVVVASNQENAYMTSKSPAGAYGQFQFIPSTYRGVVEQYPRAHLIPDFRFGMRDHLNAAKASLLLFDSDLSRADKEHRSRLRENPEQLALYLASAYNCGAKRTLKAIGGYGNAWREHLPLETRVYLKKIELVNGLLKGR